MLMRRLVIALATVALTTALLTAPAGAHQEGEPKPLLPPVDIPGDSLGALSDDVEYVTGRNGWPGGHIVPRGDRLYVGSFGIGLRIYDISTRDDPVLLGGWPTADPDAVPPPVRADAVPEAREFDGRHIAALNGTARNTTGDQIRTDRSEFLDVTDPENPILLHEFVGQDDGEAHLGHFVVGQRLWVPSGGFGAYGGDGGLPEGDRPDQPYEHHRGLRIYDLAPLIDADPGDCDAGAGWQNPCAPELLFAADPVELWEQSPFRGDREVGDDYTHTHDATPFEGVYVEGLGVRDLILLAEGGVYLDDAGNSGSAFVIDITDPTDPVALLRFVHPGYDDGRDHDPIRYYHEARLLDGDPSIMMITDEDMHSGCDAGGAIYFVRLSADYTEATPLSEWHVPTVTPAPVCSVHNFTTDGHLVYIGSYNAGLQILDISDPENPERVGYYVAEGTTAWGAYFYDGLIYVGDMTRGLDVFRFTGEVADPPPAPEPDDPEDPDPDAPTDDLPSTGGGIATALLALLGLLAAVLVRRHREDSDAMGGGIA